MEEKKVNEKKINKTMTMIYWKEDDFWLGKILEHPEIMTQGLALEELELNLQDAFGDQEPF